jgi:hypothetical protein
MLDGTDACVATHPSYLHFQRALRHVLISTQRRLRCAQWTKAHPAGPRGDILFPPVPRPLLPLLLVFASAGFGHDTRNGWQDAAFADIPFEQWVNGGEHSNLRWTTSISEPGLSSHQRLSARLFAQVDGRELARRRGSGKLLVLVQIDDAKGHTWQNHQEMDLENVQEGIKASDAVFSQLFFVLPGDYRVITALYDTDTREHSISKRHLHVSALKNDPLPEAGRDLPAIEFVGPSMPPEGWFLPTIRTKLNLKAQSREPMDVELLVNLTPSERLSGSSRVQNRNLSSLLPATKVLSSVDWGAARFGVELLDLSRRKITYQHRGSVDWTEASAGLSDVNPGVINVSELQNRWYMAQFFLDEVSRKLTGPSHKALIVLSSSVEFQGGQDIRPLSAELGKNATVFYVRYQPLFYGRGRGRGASSFPPVDQLAGLLKPLDPRVFDVATPDQFRKVLATILGEISKL